MKPTTDPTWEAGDVVDHPDLDTFDTLDYVLGEGPEPLRRAFAERLGRELDLALEVGETVDLLEGYRALSVQPSGRVLAELTREFEHRRRLRRRRDVPTSLQLGWIAAAAAIWFGLSCLGSIWLRGSTTAAELGFGELPRLAGLGERAGGDVPAVAAAVLPVRVSAERETISIAERFAMRPDFGPQFARALEKVLGRPFDRFEGTACVAENLVARSQRVRRRADVGAGFTRVPGVSMGDPGTVVGARSEHLAVELTARLAALDVEAGFDPLEQALVLRALVAQGGIDPTSALRLREVADALCGVVDLLPPGARVSVLLALAEYAVGAPLEYGRFVAERSDAVVATLLSARRDGGRPELLHWSEPLGHIADAGRLLRIAPAFGASADRAFFARCLLAAHLEERAGRLRNREHPELWAAQIYGFGDLVDREATDEALRFWSLRLLAPDFLAVAHRTWGSFPVRSGWADVKSQMLELACVPTPASTGDLAALLLALCADVANVEAAPRGEIGF